MGEDIITITWSFLLILSMLEIFAIHNTKMTILFQQSIICEEGVGGLRFLSIANN